MASYDNTTCNAGETKGQAQEKKAGQTAADNVKKTAQDAKDKAFETAQAAKDKASGTAQTARGDAQATKDKSSKMPASGKPTA